MQLIFDCDLRPARFHLSWLKWRVKLDEARQTFCLDICSGTVEQLWDRGAPLVTQYWGVWGGIKHFFLLILYNFKNIGEGHVPPPAPQLRGSWCSMFHKTGSCSTLYICLVMQITSYGLWKQKVPCIIRIIANFWGEISEKICVMYTGK